MSLVKRLRLEQNWMLVVAVAAVPIAGLYLIFRMLSPLDYPEWQTGTVVYPLLLLYHNTAFTLNAASLISLFGLLFLFWWRNAGEAGCGVIILALVAVAALTMLTGGLGIALLFVLLIVAIILMARHKPVTGLTAFFMLLAVSFSCAASGPTIFEHVSHKTSTRFSDRTYHLAFRRESDFDCNDHYYILYQCDTLGLMCEPVYISEMYGDCLGLTYLELPTSVEFSTDSTAQELYLQFDGETVYTVQADVVQ